MSADLPDDPTVVDAALHDLAQALLVRHVDGDLEPSLVRVRTDDAGLEVATRPLEGDHPAVWLTGHRVGHDVDAIGVVTGGRMFSLDDPSATLGRAAIVSLVSRRGEVACASVDHDGKPLLDDRVSGVVVDLLKRVVGVDTDPPPCTAGVLFVQNWLLAIIARADDEPSLGSFTDLCRLHLAVDLFERSDDPRLTVAQMADLLGRFDHFCTWKMLRRLLDRNGLPFPGLNRGEGAWFDDGSFARRVLAERPTLGRLRREACRRLPSELWHEIAAALDGAGVPATCWPDPDQPADLGRSA